MCGAYIFKIVIVFPNLTFLMVSQKMMYSSLFLICKFLNHLFDLVCILNLLQSIEAQIFGQRFSRPYEYCFSTSWRGWIHIHKTCNLVWNCLILSWQDLNQDFSLFLIIAANKHQGGNCSDLGLEDFGFKRSVVVPTNRRNLDILRA